MGVVGESIVVYEPGSFDRENHFYPRVLNAQVHPMVRYFMEMGNERIIRRYSHLHPEANKDAVRDLLSKPTKYFKWGGADIFQTTNEQGHKSNVIIETNSSPSGQKSMPFLSESDEHASYRTLIEKAFLPLTKSKSLPKGGLAILHDKNPMETTAYASTLSDLANEPVYLVPWDENETNPLARFDDKGVLEIFLDGKWEPIRAALKYVTQKPWNRIPPLTKTLIFNPVLCCLAGGRNKLLASKAYDMFNASMNGTGLQVNYPDTIWDVSLEEIPLWVQRMGGCAVVKNPYSNAGQGVWTVTNPKELEVIMNMKHRYDRFIVQALVGNLKWSSIGKKGKLYHVGTVPNKKGEIFVVDFRFMIGVSPTGAFPCAIYARKARKPLIENIDKAENSWEILGTNLSVKKGDGWGTESERLLMMDSRDFNHLGLGVDDLIEAYIQSVLVVHAIDHMSQQLVSSKGDFRSKLFKKLNPDDKLAQEICSYA